MANYITPDLTATEIAPYGILSPSSVVSVIDHGAWEAMLEYTDYGCGIGLEFDGICTPGVSETVKVTVEGDADPVRRYYPFSISTTFECSSLGMTPEEISKLAEENLESITQKAIEMDFSDGVFSKNVEGDHNSYLTDGTAVDVTPNPGTAISPKAGLAVLEDKLGDMGAGVAGTIHATRSAASRFHKRFEKDDEFQGAMRTRNGNYVVSGVGYSGKGPNGEETKPGEVWMYATGRTYVALSPIEITPVTGQRTVHQAIDIKNNRIKYIASRTAAVVHSGCVKYAVLVDITK